MVAGKSADAVSRELIELAEKAAGAYREDKIKFRRVQPMKVYLARTLRAAGLQPTDDRFRQMGLILGRRGGQKAAKRRREGKEPEPVTRQSSSFRQPLLPFPRFRHI